jgi:hypothetical protein
MITGREALEIAQRNGLDRSDAATLRGLADTVDEAKEMAAEWAEEASAGQVDRIANDILNGNLMGGV